MNEISFTQKWLQAREKYDSNARSLVLDNYYKKNKKIFENIIDIGCGTGSFLRWMSRYDFSFNKMLMIDNDIKLLNRTYSITKKYLKERKHIITKKSLNTLEIKDANNKAVSQVRIMKGDITKLFSYICDYNFINFSAIADILPKAYIDKIFNADVKDTVFFFSICYNGKIIWNDKNKYNKYILSKFNKNQQSIKNNNYVLGPRSVDYILKKAKKNNYKYKQSLSLWNLTSDTIENRDFHCQYLETIYKALKKDNNVDFSILKKWKDEKLNSINNKRLKTSVHHNDILILT